MTEEKFITNRINQAKQSRRFDLYISPLVAAWFGLLLWASEQAWEYMVSVGAFVLVVAGMVANYWAAGKNIEADKKKLREHLARKGPDGSS